MSTIRAYASSSGDIWELIRDDATYQTHVRHTPNPASGGQSSELTLADFLEIEPHSPQHQAVAALVGTATSPDRTQGIVSYVHDPKELGGPYIAVVFRPGGEPSVTVHKSREEADRQIARQAANLKQTTFHHSRGDGPSNP